MKRLENVEEPNEKHMCLDIVLNAKVEEVKTKKKLGCMNERLRLVMNTILQSTYKIL